MDSGNQLEIREVVDQINSYYESIPDLTYEGHTGEIDNILTALETGKRPMITGRRWKKDSRADHSDL